MIAIATAAEEHAVWIESSLRKSQTGASFVEPLRPAQLLACTVYVATLPDSPAEWIGWIASLGDIVAYVYVREAARRMGVASELLAYAAAAAQVSSVRAATWTRGADRLSRRLAYSHRARRDLDRAIPSASWARTSVNQHRRHTGAST